MEPTPTQPLSRGQRLQSLNTEAGGRAAPGFFERIRERENLEDEARAFLKSENNARRMVRNAYQRAVQFGEYDPQLLVAKNSLDERRSAIDRKFKTGMESPEEATTNYLKDFYEKEKLNPTGQRPEAFDSRLAEMYKENTDLLDPDKLSAAMKAALAIAQKKQDEAVPTPAPTSEVEE
jgi:hypothetical protein